jgi:predicted sulfurtransferase
MSWKVIWKQAATPRLSPEKIQLLKNIQDANMPRCKSPGCEKVLQSPEEIKNKHCSECQKQHAEQMGRVMQDPQDVWEVPF